MRRNKNRALALAFALLASVGTTWSTPASATPPTIVTFAGTGTNGYSGDGGQATLANISAPAHMAFDSSGNMYLADNGNVVRKITPSGVISTFAGTSSYGFSGDSGAATSAQLATPNGVAVDSSGNVFIADYNNNRVRKVTVGGVISTYAGTGTGGYSGDGSAATSAQLSQPASVAFDPSGDLLIADSGNNRIRMVTPGGTISTIAGTGTNGFSGDSGAATSAQIDGPISAKSDLFGNIYIADSNNNRIRKISTSGIITTFAGTGTYGYNGDGGSATGAQLSSPQDMVVAASGNVYIADTGNHRVRMVDPSGIISTVVGTGTNSFSGDGGAATSSTINHPDGMALDRFGNLYLADYNNRRVRMVNIADPAAATLVNVSAVVDPSFTFTVAGRASTCNAQSATNFQTGSTGTGVSLGHITAASIAGGAQDLSVGTNAANGFVVFIRTSGTTPNSLRDGGGHSVADVAGTNASPGSAPVAGTAGFGYTTGDTSTAFTSNTWAKLTSTNSSVIIGSAGTQSKSACLGYEVAVASTTSAGSYSSSVVYTAVPSF